MSTPQEKYKAFQEKSEFLELLQDPEMLRAMVFGELEVPVEGFKIPKPGMFM